MPTVVSDTNDVTVDGADPLAPLFAPLASLHGVGVATGGGGGGGGGGERVVDLLFHLPESYLDRRNRPTVRTAVAGAVATLELEVVSVAGPEREGQPWRATCRDATGFMELVWFRQRPPATVVAKAMLLVSGRVDRFGDRLQMVKPDHVLQAGSGGAVPGIEAVWGLTAGLFPGQVRGAMRRALEAVPDLPEWHDPALLRREGWPSFREALAAAHFPPDVPGPEVRARLAYDELLAHQVAMAWARTRDRSRPGRAVVGDGQLRAEALRRFGHALTEAQKRALAEIDADLAAPRRMRRLLQGDVGSGKTVVAVLAMLRAVEAGHQAALMAPTEVLAKQHLRVLQRLSPRPVGLLTGNVKGVERRRVLGGLASGRLSIVVGTHALFQEAVEYRDLAVAVIDEQHRFGVAQRMGLGRKGARTDVLVMTATPIPRSLLLTQWGEMDISRLYGKPAGRMPVRTTLHSLSTLPGVEDGIARAVERGDRVFWVCPLVSESEVLDFAAADARYAALAERFGDVVGLAHGQQDPGVRDRAMADFAAGRLRVLVATTVVEVGVDVPEASVMVIEHAERFGLAQLHQLRGRVGRGGAQSYCLLLHDDGLTETMRRRLVLLRDTEDGFAIADEDFRLRGGGELLGKRQSGLPGYVLADAERDERLIAIAAKDAAVVLEREPGLDGARGAGLRTLLRLFERREAVRTLEAG